jgi:acetyl esterase/lipase
MSIVLTPASAAGRRVARALALEPGGPPTPQARAVSQVLRALLKTPWQYGPAGEAGLRFMERITRHVPGFVPRGVVIDHVESGEWVRAGVPDERKAFLYFHGGAYHFGSPTMYRPLTWRLSAATSRPVLAVDYRLAPRHTPSDALTDARAAYDSLLAQGLAGRDIVIGGDSAGGHLALALLHALKAAGRPLPAAAIVLSPWADLLCRADSHVVNARSDRVLPAARLAWTGEYYCGDRGRDDPLFAPINGDYTGLPPLMLISSDAEILRDDARRVAALARQAGVRVVHQEWRGLVHVFPEFADYIPEGKAAFRHMADFLRTV